MPHILSTLEFAAQTKDRLWQMMTRVYEQLARVINGQISFGIGNNLTIQPGIVTTPPSPPGRVYMVESKFSDNIDCVWIEGTFFPNTDLFIIHNLGRNGSAYLVCRKSTPVDFYDSPSMNTLEGGNWVANHGKQQYILRATVQCDAVLLFF
jgi:hypothetical protein